MLRATLQNTKGFLFDLNGVFYVDDQPIAGGKEAIEFVREKGLPCRFTTNTTTSSVQTLEDKLHRMGLPIQKEEILTPARSAALYLHKLGNPSIHLVVAEDTKKDFAQFEQDHTSPDAIVIGDIGDRWNYQIMNKLFEMVVYGARIVALHKSRYSQKDEGLHLDIGAFVTGLEYATGKEAVIIGKPSPDFFSSAAGDLDVPPSGITMVGDDINSDVGGAQEAGFRGVLVKTGKYRPELVAESGVEPDGTLESIAELREYL